MAHAVGLDVSQKTTAILDEEGVDAAPEVVAAELAALRETAC